MQRYHITIKHDTGTVIQEFWAYSWAEAVQVAAQGYGKGIISINIMIVGGVKE